jgi:hypothetical protein
MPAGPPKARHRGYGCGGRKTEGRNLPFGDPERFEPRNRREPFERPPHPSPSPSLREDTYFDPRTKVLAAASPRGQLKYLQLNGYSPRRGIFDRVPPPYFSLIYRRLEDHDHRIKAMGGPASQNTAVTRSAHTGPDLPEAWRRFHGQKAAYSGFHDQRFRFETTRESVNERK